MKLFDFDDFVLGKDESLLGEGSDNAETFVVDFFVSYVEVLVSGATLLAGVVIAGVIASEL